MPCKVTIKSHLEKAVEERSKEGLNKTLGIAEKIASDINNEFGFTVVRAVQAYDYVDMRVDIPKDLVDLYYANELKIEQEQARQIQREDAERTGIDYSDDYLFGRGVLGSNLEFSVNTINVVSNFLDKIGIKQELVDKFISPDGSTVEGALAAANFIKGTVEIISDLEKRPAAWNKLPEEAAHWWYRLLKEDNILKNMLWKAHETALKADALYRSKYSELATSPDQLKEEAIGQLIAESIKRIEEERGNLADYSFFKKFLEWLNKIIRAFKTTKQDPFEVAAMKILASDTSDLLSWEEYNELNNRVYFNDQLTHQSVAPVDLSLFGEYRIISRPTADYTMYYLAEQDVDFDENGAYWVDDKPVSPNFENLQDLYNWAAINLDFEGRQKKILQEAKDHSEFFEGLINRKFKKKTKYLKKTIEALLEKAVDASFGTSNFDVIVENFQHDLMSSTTQEEIKKLKPWQKETLKSVNNYQYYYPTLKVLPSILSKYKNRPITLSEVLKIDGLKKEESKIIEAVKTLIINENPGKKTITAEELVSEIHNFLKLNYVLGFANEQDHLTYRVDFTFESPSNTVNPYLAYPIPQLPNLDDLNEDIVRAMTPAERLDLYNRLMANQQNPSIYHNKISLRFNDYYFQGGHFPFAPSVWGNLTYFYSKSGNLKDAVLLHELQDDQAEKLKGVLGRNPDFILEGALLDLERKSKELLKKGKIDFESINNLIALKALGIKSSDTRSNALARSLYSDLYNYIKNLKYTGYSLDQITSIIEGNYRSLMEDANEQVSLYESAPGSTVHAIQKDISDLYDTARKIKDFIKVRGGLKSMAKEFGIDLESMISNINSSQEIIRYDDGNTEQFPSNLRRKKDLFIEQTKEFVKYVKESLQKMYGKNSLYFTRLVAPSLPVSKRARALGETPSMLNPSIKFLFAFNERIMLDNVYKLIARRKQEAIYALGRLSSYRFNKRLLRLTESEYSNLLNNAISNYHTLNSLLQRRKRELELGDKAFLTTEEIIEAEYEATRKKTIEVYEKFQEERRESLKEAEQVLNMEANKLVPLIHHLIQKHIKEYGKEIPMYFSGFNITMLTQNSFASASLYAGKEEVKFTEIQAKIIKYNAAVKLGLVKGPLLPIYYGDEEFWRSTFPNSFQENEAKIEEAIKALKNYKYKGDSESRAVSNAIRSISGDSPIETGYIYNVMSKISGIKLIWVDKVSGIKGNTGGYLIDLTNYHYTSPLLYGKDTSEMKENTLTLKDGKEYTYDEITAQKLLDMKYSPEEIGQILKDIC